MLTLLLALLAQLAWAQTGSADCTYKISPDNIKIKWQAFKTPSKVAVEGQFKKVTIKGHDSAKSIVEILKGTTLIIDAMTVFTKDASRDKKIVDTFFATMASATMLKDTKIHAQVTEIKNDLLNVNITMNGVTKIVPLSFSEQNGKFRATGYLDILDFSMSSQLQALNAACMEKHEGKTWNDVAIEISALFKKTCI